MKLIKDLLSSKKFVSALLGMATVIAVKLGVPEATITELIAIISPILVYIGAQGFADQGKEAEKIVRG